jgi:hypothetical protein
MELPRQPDAARPGHKIPRAKDRFAHIRAILRKVFRYLMLSEITRLLFPSNAGLRGGDAVLKKALVFRRDRTIELFIGDLVGSTPLKASPMLARPVMSRPGPTTGGNRERKN